jgi:cytochrome c553
MMTVLWAVLAVVAARPPAALGQAADFFESRIRPVLADKCFACHGPNKQRGGLRLDSPAGLRKGGDSGPVVVPGHPEKSLLIQAIRQAGERKMPPKDKLSAQAVADLTAWVKMGAPWPHTPGTAQEPDAAEAWKKHWAFQPVRRPAVPQVPGLPPGASPVDAFLATALRAKGLSLSPPADPRTLLRRVTFDLTGLPPTAEEIEAFVAEYSAKPQAAWERVIDRLLASPHYGERWGRHWLDIARYADTKGYVFEEERKYAYSYTYRDYVIRAFNEDKPYDRFLIEQLAADRLGGEPRTLAAMGFVTLGRRFLNNPHDIIDDRIDVVSRGLLGLTVACARCHDHKYDPIPTKDYYSLYGVFASSFEPKDLPLIAEPERTPAYVAFEKELKAHEQKRDAAMREERGKAMNAFRARAADYLLAAHDAQRRPGEHAHAPLSPVELSRAMVRSWENFLAETRKAHHPVLAPWHAFAALPQQEFAAKAPAVAARVAANADPKKPISPPVARAFAGAPPASLREVAARYAALFAEAEKQGTRPEAGFEAVRQVLYSPASPINFPEALARRFLNRAARDRLTALQKQIDRFRANSPAAPPRAMVLQDLPSPVTPRVLLRGNPNSPGPVVPRQFLGVLAGPQRKPFTDGSGRLELARAIASKDNPLTARVLVNRVWLHHFGRGLVATPSDFGLRSEPPTHPELLDYLAWRFMEEGWSVKRLHRLILRSRAYQQSSTERADGERIDPENRLLWRMNRRRLDFEAMRDALLAVSGALDRTAGGPAVDITKAPFSGRRTVYGFIDRQNLPGMFRTFDFASPDTSTGQRFATTVPQQALFLMNSPFVLEQARTLVRQPDIAGAPAGETRVQRLYRRIYGRAADRAEVALGLRYLEAARGEAEPAAAAGLGSWERYAQVLLLANEFLFVD